MASILVYIETRGGAVLPISFELLDAARKLATAGGYEVEALVAAADPAALTGELKAADRVLSVAHPALTPYSPQAHAAVVASVIAARKPAIALFGYSTAGLDLAPAAALAGDAALVAYATDLALEDGALAATSQLYGGKLAAKSKATLPAVAAVVPGRFSEEAGRGGSGGAVETIAPPAALGSLAATVVGETLPDAGGVNLTEADKILCVGRGIGDKDKIEIAAEVAGLLGAELAGSRPIIDNGWLEKARQVGKSGTKVKPKLYIAVGVSGAPEHLEGMGGAELIVAVNSDAQAPIFGVAHFGTTCDLFDLLPAVAERLRG